MENQIFQRGKMSQNPFDYVNSISSSKKNLIVESDNPEIEEAEYQPFMVNRALSQFMDCVLYANEINHFPNLDKKLQYEYLLNSIRPKKRFSGKWAKKDVTDDLEFIMDYFSYSREKAKSALTILSDEQIKELRSSQETGGYGHF